MSDDSSEPTGSRKSRHRWPPPEGAWYDVLSKTGLTKPIERALVRHVGISLVTWATRVNRGLEYIPTLLLTTVGRQTGKLRDTALGYYVYDGRVILVASAAGKGSHPAWYRNLQTHPLVWLTIKRKQYPFDTHTATGDERDAIWSYVKSRIPEYDAYERRAIKHAREIPIVVCTPRNTIPGLQPW